jgi:hypothetical protein
MLESVLRNFEKVGHILTPAELPMLRFSKGDYIVNYGDGDKPFKNVKLIAQMPTMRLGWTRWDSGFVVKQIMGLVFHQKQYHEGNGRTLLKQYNTQEKAEELVKLGDMSVLGETESRTVYYGRDRGEEDTEGVVGDTLEEVWDHMLDHMIEYTYVFDCGKWWVGDPDDLIQLGRALIVHDLNPCS